MPVSAPPKWAEVKNKPSTVAEFGISDMASQAVNQANKLANDSGSAPSYACRAWVNFNGTGTVQIRASGNVSSITDNGTGDYTVNFTTAMQDENYSVVSGTNAMGGTYQPGDTVVAGPMNASSCKVWGYYNQFGARDVPYATCAVFR
jgi:hypothetical protein